MKLLSPEVIARHNEAVKAAQVLRLKRALQQRQQVASRRYVEDNLTFPPSLELFRSPDETSCTPQSVQTATDADDSFLQTVPVLRFVLPDFLTHDTSIANGICVELSSEGK